MPHIPKNEYEPVRHGGMASTPGRLNWLITDMIIDYVNTEGLSYSTIHLVRQSIEELKTNNQHSPLAVKIAQGLYAAYPNELWPDEKWLAVLGNVWDEFYRLVAAPYENEAMERNGNAYERLWNVVYQKREAEKQKFVGFRPEVI